MTEPTGSHRGGNVSANEAVVIALSVLVVAFFIFDAVLGEQK
jgi:hypothetical protein